MTRLQSLKDKFDHFLVTNDDDLITLHEQGDSHSGDVENTLLGSSFSYFQEGNIGARENIGINFKKLGIETIYNKKILGDMPDEELSIFIIVHGGRPIDYKDVDQMERINNTRKRIMSKMTTRSSPFRTVTVGKHIPIQTSISQYGAFPWNANRIHTYTAMGSNVRMNDLFPKLYFHMYCRENVLALILMYLTVQYYFSSRNDNKIYPYKKIYSRRRIGPSHVNFTALSRGNESDYNSNNSNKSNNNNFHTIKKKRKLQQADTAMLDVIIGFGKRPEKNESTITFMYTKRSTNKFETLKINLKQFEKMPENSPEKVIWELSEGDVLYLSDLMFYIDSIIPKNLYISYNLVYCQGDADDVEMKEENPVSFSYIQKGYARFDKNSNLNNNSNRNDNKKEVLAKLSVEQKEFYKTLLDINKNHKKYKFPKLNASKVMSHEVSLKDIIGEGEENIFKPFYDDNKDVLDNIQGTDFEKIQQVLKLYKPPSPQSKSPDSAVVIGSRVGGKRNKQKEKIKPKPKSKQEKKKIKNVVVKPKTTSKSESKKVKDGRTGKYKCNGHTHKTKEALNKCKNKK